MNLPEIRNKVAVERLNRRDWVSCARVSKAWYSTFLPLIYRDLDLADLNYVDHSMMIPTDNPTFPTCSTIGRHANHIQKLSVSIPCTYLTELSFTAHNLKSLTLISTYEANENIEEHLDNPYSSCGKSNAVNYNSIRRLITDNHSLRYLELQGFDRRPFIASMALRQARHYCPGLDSVILTGSVLSPSELVELVSSSSRLSSLSVENVIFIETDVVLVINEGKGNEETFFNPRMEAPPSPPLLPSMTTLQLKKNIFVSFSWLMNWAAQCPRLKSLSLEPERSELSLTGKDVMPDLLKIRQNPELRDLGLYRIDLNDSELSQVFKCLTELQQLDLGSGTIGPEAFTALGQFFGSLTRLSLSPQCLIEAWMFDRILCSCPNLETLALGHLEADAAYLLDEAESVDTVAVAVGHDFGDASSKGTKEDETTLSDQQLENIPPARQERRWVCTGLRNFVIFCLVLSSQCDRNDRILRELGALKELNTLTILGITQKILIDTEDGSEEEIQLRFDPTEGYVSSSSTKDEFSLKSWRSGEYDHEQLKEAPELVWMTHMWPKLSFFVYSP
ncbi:hypothetical protein BGZ83_010992 [Gryganskiella cystojenkinii]|nr:hypothetical protein BGZ83_010992 [Gryganskiella cystojenkinii]